MSRRGPNLAAAAAMRDLDRLLDDLPADASSEAQRTRRFLDAISGTVSKRRAKTTQHLLDHAQQLEERVSIDHALGVADDPSGSIESHVLIFELLDRVELDQVERELVDAVAQGIKIGEHARRNGVAPSTMRGRWQSIRKKFARAADALDNNRIT